LSINLQIKFLFNHNVIIFVNISTIKLEIMNKSYKMIFGALAIIIIALTTVLYFQHTQNQEIQQGLEAEKDSLTTNLLKLRDEYHSLETTNDTLNRNLLEEQVKVETLLKEIKRVKVASYSEISKYKKELGTLREIMRSYIKQIDSLNTRNQMLMAENEEIKTQFTEEQKKTSELSEKAKELESQVALGSRLITEGMVIEAVTRRDNSTKRARKAVKIKACFTIKKNAIAEAGSKIIYMRVMGPDGFVMAKSPSDIISVEGENVVFSAQRELVYENQDIDMCIFWDVENELVKGIYKVNIYTEGYELGAAEVLLK